MNIFEPGSFVTGCNYWASHAGTNMWSDWREDVVRKDLKHLSDSGLQQVRAFPLWPVFQPLTLHYGCFSTPKEIRMGEKPLPHTEAGRAGVDEEAMEKFRTFLDIAQENNLRVSVALVTGWMSGRIFAPPAFERLNLLNDPLVIKWQVRFIRYFVKTFKNHPAVMGWGPGNECNCMAPLDNKEQAWNWMNTICSAIRREDPLKPVFSGMHSLHPAKDEGFNDVIWSIQDQGEHCDILTTHPYPKFTPYAMQDPINQMRNCFHATAESRFYADISGRPCIPEELGTLAAVFADEEVKADYIRTTLYNLWAHDCKGLIWWCGFDQLHLDQTPYDWNATERELGLCRNDYSNKPVADVLKNFIDMVEKSYCGKLPMHKREAVCVITPNQDAWANAWSSFILAKQAGFDIEFQYMSDKLKDSELYIVPGIKGTDSISKTEYAALIEKVKAGATMYISLDDGVLSPFSEYMGINVKYTEEYDRNVLFDFDHSHFDCTAPQKLTIENIGAEILAKETDGNPLFIRHKLGQGTIYLLTVPVEKYLSQTRGVFHDSRRLQPFYKLYKTAAAPWLQKRILKIDEPTISVTEHEVSEDEIVAVLVNNSPRDFEGEISIADQWTCNSSKNNTKIMIKANDGLFLKLMKTDSAELIKTSTGKVLEKIEV